MVPRLALVLVLTTSCFDGSLPENAQVFCTSSEDCLAPSTCNTTTHLCSDDLAPPQIIAFALVDAPDDLTYADADGFNDITVSLTANEPIATMTLALDILETTCSITATCTLTIPVDTTVPSGAHDLIATVTDVVGNEATATLSIIVDTEAPTIVEDSVEVAIDTGGTATQSATTSSVVTVSFLSDEDLGAPPNAFLDVDGVAIALDIVALAGRRATFRYDDARVIVPGTYVVRAALVDRFGHASAAPLFDLTFVDDGELCPRPAGVTCVDFDGDGAFAASSCGAGTDPNDRDATVFPGAIDLPGDGIDNDGVGGDDPIDEITGVFFDCANGDDATADGSRAAPYRTMGAAYDARGGLVPVAFLAECGEPYLAVDNVGAENSLEAIGILGGLDSATWTRTGARTALRSRLDVFGFADSIETPDPVAAFEGIVVRSQLSSLDATNDVRVVASTIGSLASLGATVVSDATIADVFIDGPTQLHRVHVTEGINLVNQASLVATSSVLQSASGPAIETSSALSIALFHTTVLGLDTLQVAALSATGIAEIRVVATSFVSVSTFPVVDVEEDVLTLVDTNIYGPGEVLRVGIVTIDADDVNNCATCVRAEGNSTVDPESGVDFRLPATSPLRVREGGAGDAVLAFEDGAPTTVVGDFDGDCRYADGSADIGADEVAP